MCKKWSNNYIEEKDKHCRICKDNSFQVTLDFV